MRRYVLLYGTYVCTAWKINFYYIFYVLTLALALLCASASLSRSFSYLSWASPPPPPSGGFGAGPFSTPSFFGLSEPAFRKKTYKYRYKQCCGSESRFNGVHVYGHQNPGSGVDPDSLEMLDPDPDPQLWVQGMRFKPLLLLRVQLDRRIRLDSPKETKIRTRI